MYELIGMKQTTTVHPKHWYLIELRFETERKNNNIKCMKTLCINIYGTSD